MCGLINHVVYVPLWAIAALGLIGLLLIALDGWRTQQWQHLALLASRVTARPASPSPSRDRFPSPLGPLDEAAEPSSTPPDNRHTTTRSTT